MPHDETGPALSCRAADENQLDQLTGRWHNILTIGTTTTVKRDQQRSARNAHRKLQDARFTKAYEVALMEWFQRRVLGIDS